MKKKNYWPLAIFVLLLLGAGASQLPIVRDKIPMFGTVDEKLSQRDENKQDTASADNAGEMTADKESPNTQDTNGDAKADAVQADKGEEADNKTADSLEGDGTIGENAPETVKEANAQGAPTFNLLVMDQEGSLVVTGTALGGASVELFEGKEVIGTTQSEESGDFAFAITRKFAPGAHEFSLGIKREDGTMLVSTQTCLVNVPDPKEGGQLLATLFENGKVKKVLQRQNIIGSNRLASKQTPEKEAETAAEISDELIPGQVYIDAVEVDDNEVIVAGKGKPGEKVQIYIDQKLLGKDKVGKEGSYLVQAPLDLAEGLHDVRADMLDGFGKVFARALVKLQHGEARQQLEQADEAAQAAEAAKTLSTNGEASVLVATDSALASKETDINASGNATTPDTAEKQAMTQTGNQQVATAEPKTEGKEPEVIVNTDAGIAGTKKVMPDKRPDAKILHTGDALIIRRGDNLWNISRRKYGEGTRYTTIYEANREQIKDPALIYPGQVIDVPKQKTNQSEPIPSPNPAKTRQ